MQRLSAKSLSHVARNLRPIGRDSSLQIYSVNEERGPAGSEVVPDLADDPPFCQCQIGKHQSASFLI